MHIGLLGPVSLDLLQDQLAAGAPLPEGYPFPQNALLAKELIRLGHRVSFFTLSPGIEGPVTFSGTGLTVHIGRYRRSHRARDFFRTEINDLVRLMRSDPCDVYGAHWLYEFALAGTATRDPLVITVHDWPLQVLRHQFTPYRFVRLLMAVRTLEQFRGELVAVSPYISQAIRAWTGRDAVVIPNGIEASAVSAAVVARSARRSVFLSIANGFGKLKNTATLMRAFAQTRNRHPSVELHFIGAGHEAGGPAEAWARSNGVAEGVRFLGPLPYDQTQARLESALALVHPSLEESFGRTLIEAMAKGTPTIGGKTSGAVPWVLGNGAAGLLIDVTSVDDLDRGMRALIESASLWNSYSATGRTVASSKFSIHATAEAYAHVLSDAISARTHSVVR